MGINYAREIEKLTVELVGINSVCEGNGGESRVAEYVRDWFLKTDYFKKHKTQVKTFECVKGRKSTVAWIKGKGSKTIILMGHIDTVDIKDYGPIMDLATKPDRLIKGLKDNFTLPKDVVRDMDSGNYLFGRGALDMKSGVAAYMVIMKHFACHPEELEGNLVLVCECDEEGNSKGIIKALDVLKELKEKEGFEYVACINGDYSTSDNNERYVYLGTVGKLLPCFMAIGKESHVGDPFGAFDPNLLISVVNKNMALNMDLADEDIAKTSVPPISLKQCDDKDSYTVQTALSAAAYFNWMIYHSSPSEVMKKCLKIGEDSFKEVNELMDRNYRIYCEKNGLTFRSRACRPRVYSYAEWLRLLSKDPRFLKDMDDYAKKLLKEDPDIDMRDYSCRLIRHSYGYYERKEPVLIVFFGSMFYSSIVTKEGKLSKAVRQAVASVNKTSRYDITISNFYPYISDMSFMSSSFKEKEIRKLLDNSPYRIDYPYEKIREIDVPVINIGTFGHGGHTYVERLEKDYSFNEMPSLVYETIINFFRKSTL